MDEETRVPRRLAAAVVIVFVTMSLGVCSLFVFIYNLPRIFPPPKGTSLSANLPTLTPESDLTDTSPTPLAAPSADFTLTATPTPLTTVPATPTEPIPTETMPAAATAAPTMPLATSTPAATPTLSPDGGHLVFTAEKSGSSIYIMAADGSGVRLLVPHEGNYRDLAPAISPSGRRLAFASNRGRADTYQIYLMAMDSSGLSQLTSGKKARNNTSPSWFPDGQQMAFTSNRDGHWNVYTMSDDGSHVQRVIGGNQDITEVTVSPDGATLAYTCGMEICLANADGSHRETLLKNGLPKGQLAWSPEGALLAFTQREPEGSTSVYAVDRQGNSRRMAANADSAAWSPSGALVEYASNTDGGTILSVINPNTGQTRRVATQASADDMVWVP